MEPPLKSLRDLWWAVLRALGHEVTAVRRPLWNPSVLAIDPASGAIEAAGDPDAGRHAAAY